MMQKPEYKQQFKDFRVTKDLQEEQAKQKKIANKVKRGFNRGGFEFKT